MMKPAIGMTPRESAEVFRQVALGGADGVKDDELLVSHPWSHFIDRVREHERAAHEAFEVTGHRTLYFVNITDRPDRLRRECPPRDRGGGRPGSWSTT